MVITKLANIRYLTGFSGSNAALIVDPAGHDLFATDGRYRDQAAEQVEDLPALIDRDTVRSLVSHSKAREMAIESSVEVGTFEGIRSSGIDVVPVVDAVEALRIVKDPAEQALLEKACHITSQAIGLVFGEVRPGMTERQIARRLEQLFDELGAEDRAFPSIVSLGENTAIPHHEPGERVAALGDLLLIDAGARVDGYHADMTRVAVVGSEPTRWQRELHQIVAAAAEAGRMAVTVGADRRTVDSQARAVIEAAGFGSSFSHGLGHGTGLEIHEAPFLGPRAIGTIPLFASVTVEPGVYLPGRGGIRIEDSLLVMEADARVMTPASRELASTG